MADENKRAELLTRALDSVYVKRGKSPLPERVLLRWLGEDEFDRPERGRKDYLVRPIPWPEPITDLDELAADLEARGMPAEQARAHAHMAESKSPAQRALDIANWPRWAFTLPGAGTWGVVPDELERGLGNIAER